MAPARVLIVSSTFPPIRGGSAVVYDSLCKFSDGAVIGLGPTVDYLTGKPITGTKEHDQTAGYRIYRRKTLRPIVANTRARAGSLWQTVFGDLPLMLRALASVVYIARSERANVICLGDLVYGGWMVFPLKYLFGFKVMIYVHGEEVTTPAASTFERQRARFLAHADAVVAVSGFTRDALIETMKVDPAKIALIPNGVDVSKFHVRATDAAPYTKPDSGERPLLLSVGRLVPRKGFDRLVEAMPAILERQPAARLVIAGDGPLRAALEQRIRALGLEAHVTLAGSVSDEELLRLYARADLLVLPNRQMPDGDTEGFGLVFLEANACGKPVVAGRAGGALDVVTNGVNGLTVDGDKPQEISAAVLRILEDPDLYKRLQTGGLELAQRSDWRGRAQDFLVLANRLVNRAGR